MASEQELQKLPFVRLMLLSQKIADCPRAPEATRKTAHRLFRVLRGGGKMAEPTRGAEVGLEALRKEKGVRRRAARFLLKQQAFWS
jgi:hypothetical protein